MGEPKFFEGPPCKRCGSVRRYISTGGCVKCKQEFTKPDASEPIASATERVSTGQCKHGVGLRAFCRQCETAWHSRRRFVPEIYDDLVSYEPEAVPLNFESSLNGTPARRTRSYKRRGANATPSGRAPRGRPAHAAAVAETST